MPHPVLYSLQNCPYAMRARFGLLLAKQPVMLRAVTTSNKPPEMLAISEKGTVPILVLGEELDKGENGLADELTVIDESLDIMLWALNKNDPHNLLYSDIPSALPDMLKLIQRNDLEFINFLDKYKLAKRHHDFSLRYYRHQCEFFITHLEQRLSKHEFFIGKTPSLADYAILPFIRQFARVERQWYLQSPYPNLRRWLNTHLQRPLFNKVMTKYPLWIEHHEAFIFGAD